MTDASNEGVAATRVPADIARPDRVLGPLTARQTGIVAVCGLVLYGGYWMVRPVMAPLAYVVMVVPVAGVVTAIALGSREGIGLDRFLLAALAHLRRPKRRVLAPEGVPALPNVVNQRLVKVAGPMPAAMRMPYRGVSPQGVLGLRGCGTAALATCSTVNFDLRSGAEQQGLVAAFARWLNSLTGPTQVLVRCHRTDLTPLAEQLHHHAPVLPHPALERAARAHADFLAELAAGGDLLTRQVVLVAREEATRRHQPQSGGGSGRAVQRIQEAARALAPAEISVTPLDGEQTTALVHAACNPDSPATPAAGQVEGDDA
ncbi:PrgI family protein [Streptomyces sp. NBS 14/10]|uniref:PrgI family protein n=1 Tax=Streptomyces sp. NBS 14/10 TaxID=1945643 RepID=UPI000B7FD64B|nr:PrgI family protein [Streptomyces sp. NBS 14/10]KAK1185911.1 PrgI family protein [Streptomyces sp. NBS 14/10]